MKSVGIKILKNKLSSYLDYVRKGEVVLVTDRDEVIAEIRRPSRAHSNFALSSIEAFLEDGISRGTITGPRAQSVFPKTLEDLPNSLIQVEASDLLEESRAERS